MYRNLKRRAPRRLSGRPRGIPLSVLVRRGTTGMLLLAAVLPAVGVAQAPAAGKPKTLAGRYVAESAGGWYTLEVSQDGEKDGARVKATMAGRGAKVELSGKVLDLSLYLQATGEAKISGARSPDDKGAFRIRSDGDGVLLSIQPGVPKDWNRFTQDDGDAFMREGGLADRAYRKEKEEARTACLAAGGDCRRACEEASAAACFGAGLQQEGGVYGEADVAALVRAYRRACGGGVASGCYRLATRARKEIAAGGMPEPRADVWNRLADSIATATLGGAR